MPITAQTKARAKSAGIITASVALSGLLFGTVQQYEGRSLQAYRDIVGVWTICYGETLGVHKGQRATAEECNTQLAKRLAEFEHGLDQCMLGPVSGDTKVAILSWTYNVGLGAACGSTLVKYINWGRIEAACNELPKWNRAGGKPVQGLTDRRAAERELCLKGAHEPFDLAKAA